jgi:serine/threonine-protein kinase
MENLGKYEIVEKIGEGGFGAVYKARDPHLKRIVALKTCTHDDEDLQRRFLREGEIVASLQHPNITLIHDLGFEGGTPFLVQEFLSGEDLAAIIYRRDPLDDETRFRWLLGVARGLEYAHSQGIVHRDIKPANIRILADGTSKIMDFGIAKLSQSENRLTRTGSAMGTIAYMSPEQLDGSEVDHRSDIFAFGVLAFELFALERPFDGETTSRVVYQILHEDPRRIEATTAQFNPGLNHFLRRCLAKKPASRFQSFGEVATALELVAWLLLGRDAEVPASPAAAVAPANAEPVAAAAAESPGVASKSPAEPVPIAAAAEPDPEPASTEPRKPPAEARPEPRPVETAATPGNAVVSSLLEGAERAAREARAAAERAGARELAPIPFGDGERRLAEGRSALAAGGVEAAHEAFLGAGEAFERAAGEAEVVAGERARAAAPAPSAPPAVAADSVPAPAPVAPDPQREIERLLDVYVAAYESLDAGAVVAAVPSLQSRRSELDRAFEQYRSLDVALSGCRIDVAGDRATASCAKRQSFDLKVGQSRTIESNATFRLSRRAGRWAIESVEG